MQSMLITTVVHVTQLCAHTCAFAPSYMITPAATCRGLAPERLSSDHRQIVEILRKSEDDLTEEDYEHMKKVRSYINRHTKQVREAARRQHTSTQRGWTTASSVMITLRPHADEPMMVCRHAEATQNR